MNAEMQRQLRVTGWTGRDGVAPLSHGATRGTRVARDDEVAEQEDGNDRGQRVIASLRSFPLVLRYPRSSPLIRPFRVTLQARGRVAPLLHGATRGTSVTRDDEVAEQEDGNDPGQRVVASLGSFPFMLPHSPRR